VRIAVISDVHGNLPALEASLTAIRRQGVDAYACTGDLVGYGPFPNECVEVVAELAPTWVAGNHDLIALGRLSGDRCIRLARESLDWTRTVLTDESRAALAALPLRAGATGGVVLAHGSLEDPEEYTTTSEQAARQLDRLVAEGSAAPILLLGHTHRAWAWSRDSGTLKPAGEGPLALTGDVGVILNPGAVGQSREREVRARFLVLDLERREATFFAVPYDVARCREALLRCGLPPGSYHLPPTRLGPLRSAAHRALRLTSRFGTTR
jgi:predicted phosphodiesterase